MTDWFEWQDAPQAEFGVVGDPVSHSLSPKMQMAAFSSLGLAHQYRAIRVPLSEFEAAMQGLAERGYRGLNVTVPLKEAAFRWAREIDELTRRIGAANTLSLPDRRGVNTDAPGLLDVLAEAGIRPPRRVLLLGAGGTARAAALVLESHQFEWTIFNRTRRRAEELLDCLALAAPIRDEPDIEGFDAILNTTSAELHGDVLAIDWSRAAPGAVAIDMLYRDGETEFLRGAREQGLSTMDGRAMLAAQGARSLEWWLGVEAPRSAMLKAIS